MPDQGEQDRPPRRGEARPGGAPPAGLREEHDEHGDHNDAGEVDEVEAILGLIQGRKQHDFRWYKRGTLMRRIERRMGLRRAPNLRAYREHLEQNPGEIDALFKDLLIGVTSFFREPQAFQALSEAAFPDLFGPSRGEGGARAWVPGAATGEEAYSLAMLLVEGAEAAGSDAKIQIFATDIDAEALDFARAGLYPPEIAADVSPARLERFFTREEGGYRVVQALRELIVFAAHDLVRDSPFSRLDLVSCRNLLIYLTPEAQEQVMGLLHFALSPGGYLLLGTAESVGDSAGLFAPVDKRWRIYRRVAGRKLATTDLPMRGPRLAALGRRRLAVDPQPQPDTALRTLLQHFAPPAVLVDAAGEILHFLGRPGRYLEIPAGAPSRSLLSMVIPPLRGPLRAMLRQARRGGPPPEGALVRLPPRAPETAAGLVQIAIRRVEEGEGEEHFLVVFQEIPAAALRGAAGGAAGERRHAEIRQLEAELALTQEELRSTIEQLEASNEELRASNEEVMSMNEEFQSTNEELETSREELQSLNEELITVNVQLREKVGELESLTHDLNNLLSSTDIGVLFLDEELRIKLMTPVARRLLRLLPEDRGRPLGDFSGALLAGFAEDARAVLGGSETREREVRDGAGQGERTFLRRILPYRADGSQARGAVLALVDITARRRAEADSQRLAAIVRGSHQPIISKALDGTITSWNAAAEEMYGWTAAEALGRPFEILVPPALREEMRRIYERVWRGEIVEPFDTVRVRKDGSLVDVQLSIAPVVDSDGRVTGASAIARDNTRRVEAERELRRAHELFQAALRGSPVTVCHQDADLRFTWIYNSAAGYTLEDVRGRSDVDVAGDIPEIQRVMAIKRRALETGRGAAEEISVPRGDGRRHFVLFVEPVRDESGAVTGVTTAAMDVTELKLAQARLEEVDHRKNVFLALLGHELRNPLSVIRSAADLLGRWSPEGRGREFLGLIQGQAALMNRLIDDLLDISRITYGRIALEPQRVRLRPLLERAVAASRFALGGPDARVDVEIAVEPADLQVTADPYRLEQVVGNLLSNSLRYTDGGDGARVSVAARRADGGVCVEITDNGSGFSPDALPHLFEPFWQGEPGSKEGLGLGLALSRELIQLHEGRIEAHSGGPGQGARFTIWLPDAARDPLTPAPPDPPHSTDEAAPMPIETDAPTVNSENDGPRRVLVVDDNAALGQLLSMLLEERGHQVRVTASARQALDVAREFRPEVVLLDLQMPEIDGFAALRELRAEHGASLRVLAWTGYDDDEHRRRTREAGFDGHLVKGLTLEELEESLRGIL